MYEWKVQVGSSWNTGEFAKIIESTLARLGLTQTMKSTLRSYRGSVHWHFKRHPDPGTIELTLWPQEERIWISVRSGRSANWIHRDAPSIRRELERALGMEC